ERYPAYSFRVLAALEEVQLARALQGPDQGLVAINEVYRDFELHDRPTLRHLVKASEARLLLDARYPDRAAALISQLPQSATRRLLEARLFVAREEPAAARALFHDAKFATRRDQLVAALLLTRAAIMQGDDFGGPVALVVSLAASQRFVRTILDEGASVSRAVRRAAEASPV